MVETVSRPRAACEPVVTVAEAQDLAAIRDSGVTLALWNRDCPVTIHHGALRGFDGLRFIARPEEVAAHLERGLAACPDRYWHLPIVQDIERLAAMFATVMAADHLEIRLERVTGNACWKMHADYVTARLITTYLGRGTEWFLHAAAAGGKPQPGGQLGAGAVGLFKGRVWAPEGPVLHRSPAIEGTGEQRLLLVIDPVRSDGSPSLRMPEADR